MYLYMHVCVHVYNYYYTKNIQLGQCIMLLERLNMALSTPLVSRNKEAYNIYGVIYYTGFYVQSGVFFYVYIHDNLIT